MRPVLHFQQLYAPIRHTFQFQEILTFVSFEGGLMWRDVSIFLHLMTFKSSRLLRFISLVAPFHMHLSWCRSINNIFFNLGSNRLCCSPLIVRSPSSLITSWIPLQFSISNSSKFDKPWIPSNEIAFQSRRDKICKFWSYTCTNLYLY